MVKYHYRSEPKILNESTRPSAAGQFMALENGMTHYEISGPRDKPITVLIPGFSVPYYIWDPTFEGLTSAGMRVLRYDLFGRGFSDRPDIIYNQMCFDKQLSELLTALGNDKPINLIGLSMGGQSR